MEHAHNLGRRAERAAARYLMRRGWRVLARNVRTASGELDLVATRRGTIAFCEVKARRAAKDLDLVLGAVQAGRTSRAAGGFVTGRPELLGHVQRLDLITVEPRTGWLRVRHYPGGGEVSDWSMKRGPHRNDWR